MIQVLQSADRVGHLGRLGTLHELTASELEWSSNRHRDVLRFANGISDWQCVAAPKFKSAVIATRYSPEVYVLDGAAPPVAQRMMELTRADVDAGLRWLQFHPVRDEDVLLIYELGIVMIKRCRFAQWDHFHGRLDFALVSVDEIAVRYEDEDGHAVAFSTLDGRQMVS